MNKQRFLTELKRLLVFMTDGDRELTIARYSEMFDAAGDGGEEAVLEKLGSPTKLAISLSRGYEPGQVTAEHKQKKALREATKAARTVKSRLHGVEDFIPGTQFDGDEDDPVAVILRSLDQDFSDEEEADEEEELLPEEPEEELPAPVVVYKRLRRPMPVGLGATLLTLILLVLGLPLAVLTAALLLLWLSPGAAGIVCAGLSAIAALWCIAQLADALLLFGLGFLLLAVGLILLWLGLRLDIRLVKLYIQGVNALCDALLGKKEAVE